MREDDVVWFLAFTGLHKMAGLCEGVPEIATPREDATAQRSINDPRLFVIHPSSNRRKEEDERKGSIAQQLINKSRSLNRMMELGRSSLGKQTTGQHRNTHQFTTSTCSDEIRNNLIKVVSFHVARFRPAHKLGRPTIWWRQLPFRKSLLDLLSNRVLD